MPKFTLVPFDEIRVIPAPTDPAAPKVEAILHDASEVMITGEPLGETIWQGWQWAVTIRGLECRNGS